MNCSEGVCRYRRKEIRTTSAYLNPDGGAIVKVTIVCREGEPTRRVVVRPVDSDITVPAMKEGKDSTFVLQLLEEEKTEVAFFCARDGKRCDMIHRRATDTDECRWTEKDDKFLLSCRDCAFYFGCGQT